LSFPRSQNRDLGHPAKGNNRNKNPKEQSDSVNQEAQPLPALKAFYGTISIGKRFKGAGKIVGFLGLMLLAATCLVVIGLVFEYWPETIDFIEEVRRPAAAFPRKRFGEMVGAILVTLGVAGELWFTFQASRVETSLRDNNHQIEALLTKDAGDAKTSAGNAADAAVRAIGSAKEATSSASNAMTLASGARKEADSFEKDIVSAKTQAADAESHLAEAMRQAAEAKLELERFKAPRTLNLSQQADIRARLGKFGPHRVDVIIIGDAQEIANLAGMIVAAFPEGWNVNVFKAVSGPNVSGVLVGPHTGSDRNVNAATETLISVLQSNGIARSLSGIVFCQGRSSGFHGRCSNWAHRQ
jgi:hypothetical protein